MAVAAAAAASSLEAASSGLLDGTSLASSAATAAVDADVATPPTSVPTTSPLHSSATSSSSSPPSSQSLNMMMSPLATPSPSLADAVTFSSSSSPVPGQLGVPRAEQEKVLGVTILTQLQELDLAIKHREQNKVDGRKTRWIEHRKKQEELGSSPGSASGTPTSSSSTRKRRSGSAGVRHKKENIDVSSCLITSPRSLNSSPYKTDDSSVHDSTPPDNNNITPFKLPTSPDTITMKIEVSEPLVGSVGPSNVLETMKQQFLQDTIKEALVDSAKLIKTVSDNNPVQEDTSCNAKKKKPKPVTAESTLLGKKKCGRPKRLQRGVFPNGKDQTKPLKPTKNKNAKAKAVNGSDANKKGSTTISNFFMKAKTRGLRDVRKPEETTEDPLSIEGRSSEAEVKSESESTSGSGGTTLLVPPIIHPSKCLLIAATAKVLSNKGPAAKKNASKSTKLALDARKKKCLLAAVTGGLTNGVESGSNSTVKVVKVFKKKPPPNKQNKSSPVESSGPPSKESQKQTAPDPVGSDSSESTTDATKRGRPRVIKRKHEANSCSPSPKCSKKTSTVVAEVHNSMNGEPQQSLIVGPKPGVGGRKRRPLSPVKNTSSVANASSNNSALMSNGAQHVSTLINSDSGGSNHERDPLDQQTSGTSKETSLESTSPVLSEQPSLVTVNNVVKAELPPNDTIAHSINTPPLSPPENSVQNRTSPNTRSTAIMANGAPKIVASPPTHSITNGDGATAEAAKVVGNSASNDASNTSPSRKKSASPVKLIRTGLVKVSEVAVPQSSASEASSADKTVETTSPRSASKSTPSSVKSSPSSVRSSPSANKLSPSAKKSLQSDPISVPSVNGSAPVQLQNGFVENQLSPCFVNDGILLSDSNVHPSLYLPDATKETQSAVSTDIADQEIRIKSPTDSDCDNNNRNEPEVIDISEKEKSQSKPNDDCASMNKSTNKGSDSVDAKKPRRPPRFLKALFKDEGVQNMLKSIEGENSTADGNFSSLPDAGVAHKLRPKRPPEHSMAISPEPDLEFFLSTGTGKRKRKCNEADSLYMDEGALNLLTSCSSGPRRGSLSQDDLSLGMLAVEDGRPQPQQLNCGTRKPFNESDQLSEVSVTAIVKRKPGRPQKPKSHSSKSSSPSSTPDLEIDVDAPNNRKRVDVTSRKVDDSIVPQLQASKPKGGLGTDGRVDYKLASGGTATGSSKGGYVSSSGCAVVGNSVNSAPSASTAAVNGAASSVHKQGRQSPPFKMRRADLPTSPTMSSLDSLVRSLEGSSGVVPTSGVAFMPHKVPEGIVPPLRGMRGLITADGGAAVGLRQSQRTSVRQTGDFSNVSYRDIVVRKMNNFAHIIMAPVTTKIKNSLNSRVLRELCDVLSSVRGDPSVRLVLITSNGSSFCQGVDLTCLHHSNPDTVNEHAHNLARAIKEFLRLLVQFPKPVIAGVNGNATGLGVTMLPLFDMVYASDHAEFYLPYSKLGQVPEGGATYTFPTLFGKLQATRLFMGHKFSADEGVTYGLVSEVLWPANFNEALLPKVALLATQSSQSMETTKALMNHHLLTKLELSLESECNTLLRQWTSPHFETLSRRFLESHAPLMQKPVQVPL